jgi:hypothetical protein
LCAPTTCATSRTRTRWCPSASTSLTPRPSAQAGGVEEAEEVALLGPNRRVHPAAELRGLGVPAPDVAADQMRGRHEAQGRSLTESKRSLLGILSIGKGLSEVQGRVVRATLPWGGGEGTEPPQGNRPRRGAHPAEGRCIPVRVRARAALRSLTVPCIAVGRLTVVGEAAAWDGSALCSPAAARVSPRCTHPSPKVATHRSTGPRRVKRSLRLGVLATLPIGRARGPRLALARRPPKR